MFKAIALLVLFYSQFLMADYVLFGSIQPTNQGDYVQGAPAPLTDVLTLKFTVKDLNTDELNAYLSDVSDPSSPNYGKYLSKDQIDAMLQNLPGQQLLSQFLSSVGASVVAQSPSGQVVSASASISDWNTALQTVFYIYSKPDAESVERAPQFYLPSDLAAQISIVMGVTEFPVDIRHGPHLTGVSLESAAK